LSGPPVYSRQFAFVEGLPTTGDAFTVYISPPGQVSIIREIDAFLEAPEDPTAAFEIRIEQPSSGSNVSLLAVPSATGNPFYQWTGRLVMNSGDLLFMPTIGAGVSGSTATVVVSGYSLSP